MNYIETLKEIIQTHKKEFDIYKDLLKEENKKYNLTAIIEDNDIYSKHFLDSMIGYKFIENNKKIIDIGSGAGFPSIVLKIANPTLDITLVDSTKKKVNFMNMVIEKLQLKNIKAIHCRIEELAHDKKYRSRYDYALSRAVTNLSGILELSSAFLKKNGTILSYKGPKADYEIKESQKAIKELGLKLNDKELFNIYDNHRYIISFIKIEETKNKYPRLGNLYTKKPL